MTREDALRRALREVLEEWRHQELPPRMVPRDGIDEIIPQEGGEVRALVGPRRVGKTYAMYQAVQTLENRGVPRTRIVYIDFEDPRLTGMRPSDVGVLIRVLEEYSGGPRPLLFLDEVQAIEGWGGLVRVLHTRGYGVSLTGSSSKLLAREVATSLRGRYRSTLLLGFSFREFLRARGVPVPQGETPVDSIGEARLRGLLEDYMTMGGYPQVVLSGDTALARDLVDTVLYRDVVERHGVRDTSSLRLFLRLLLRGLGGYFSLSKAHRTFKSLGIGKSKKTLLSYFHYFQEALFIIGLEKIGRGLEPVKQPYKIHPVDNLYYHILGGGPLPRGKMMESLVVQEMVRRGMEGRLFYWRDTRGAEVDIVALEGNRPVLTQVTHALDPGDRVLWRREVGSLLKAREALGGGWLQVITWDQEEELRVEGSRVRVIPLWKWILGEAGKPEGRSKRG